MKTIYLTFVLLISIGINAQSISFDIQPSNQSIFVGEDVDYNITVTSYDNFSQQIYFSVIEHSLNTLDIAFNFTPQYIEYPYNQNVLFEISISGSIDTGSYYIVIEGGNGPTTYIDTCYLTIMNNSCTWVENNLPSSYTASKIIVDKNDTPWVATGNNELMKYDGNVWSSVEFINQNFTSNIIAIDTNNNKWLASDVGLLKYDNTNWTIFNTSLSSELYPIAIDTNNNIWVGTHDIGLIKFDGIYWSVYDNNNTNLSSNYIKNIKFDKEGNLWVITNADFENNNISYFNGTNFTEYNPSNSCLPYTQIYNIDFDNDNSIWIATQNGILKYNGQEWEKWFVSSQNNNHQIYDSNCSLILEDNTSNLTYEACNYIYIDNDDNKWISNRDVNSEPPGVIIRLNNNNWDIYTPDNSTIPDNTAYCISQSENSNLWFITIQNSSNGEYNISEFDCNTYNSIKENTQTNYSINIFPNPFNNLLNINLNNKNDIPFKIEIINSLGIIVKKQTVNNSNIHINTSNIRKGIYILRIFTNNKIYTQTIIKK